MRHGKKFNHLGRTASHREALLANMASSLIKHKRINTTVAKAKALRKYVEPLLTKAKSDTTHSRRVVFSYLQNKEIVHELFSSVAEKIANRPGGYTRIIKMGSRLGDNADLCMMELVDYNELMLQEAPVKKSRRSRRGGKKEETQEAAPAAVVEEAVVVEAATDEVVEETPAAEDTSADESSAASDETPEEEK
jgi:large subunit ribosomal protein L17